MRKIVVTGMMILFIFLFSASADLERVIHVCDRGTELVQSQVALCDARGAVTVVLNSTTELRRTNAQPYQSGTLTYLYEEPAPDQQKEVHVLFTVNVSREKRFPLGSFTANLIAGQRLMLKLSGEYFLLSHEGRDRFATENLRLQHIPRGTLYAPELYAGTNRYLFRNLQEIGGRQISVGIVNDNFVISILAPGEVPATYEVQQNLTSLFEVRFTQSTPVQIISPTLGAVTLCRRDNAADRQQALVCIGGSEDGITLRENELISSELNRRQYAFLYENVDGEKRISVFSLHSLSQRDTDLDYNTFINSMIAGRRAAVKFNNNLYLLQHPVSDTFSLRDLSLVLYQNQTANTLPASGSPDAVEFPTLDGGKIFLKRNYGDPTPPFQLSAKTQEQLEPVLIAHQLFTSFSSLGAISIVTPEGEIKTIRTAIDDNRLYEPEYKITVGAESLLLRKGIPVTLPERGNILFYYHTARVQGTVPVKAGSIYQFYNLESGAQHHVFNDTFIRAITGGNEVALRIGTSYYLVGHQGNPGQVQFFHPERLTLRKIDGSETYTVAVDPLSSIASFVISEGRIDIEVRNDEKRIMFTKRAGTQLLQTTEFQSFTALLTPTNRIQLGVGSLRLCFTTAYADTPAARVCDDAGRLSARGVLVDPVTAVKLGTTTYLLESNQQTGDEKAVLIREVISLSPELSYHNPNWFDFIGKIIAENKPAFNISGTLYLPTAENSQLPTFGLGLYPRGAPRRVTAAAVTPITYKGGVALDDIVVLVEQEETRDEEVPVTVTFTIPRYSYVPDSGDALILNSTRSRTLRFITVINGEEYLLTAGTILPTGIARVKLQRIIPSSRSPEVLFDRWFALGDSRILTLNGKMIEIKVVQLQDDKVVVSIRKVRP